MRLPLLLFRVTPPPAAMVTCPVPAWNSMISAPVGNATLELAGMVIVVALEFVQRI